MAVSGRVVFAWPRFTAGLFLAGRKTQECFPKFEPGRVFQHAVQLLDRGVGRFLCLKLDFDILLSVSRGFLT